MQFWKEQVLVRKGTKEECVPSVHNACVSAASERTVWLWAEDGEGVGEYELEREQNQS